MAPLPLRPAAAGRLAWELAVARLARLAAGSAGPRPGTRHCPGTRHQPTTRRAQDGYSFAESFADTPCRTEHITASEPPDYQPTGKFVRPPRRPPYQPGQLFAGR